MIDIHTHILYGVDDGAKNLRMSLELLEEAERAGFTKVIFTSHYMEEYFTADFQKRYKILARIANTNASAVNVYIGNEIFLTGNLITLLREKKAVSLNHTRYVLFELPFNARPINLMEMIFQMQSKDFVPILAHPERYSYFYRTPEIYEELVEKGVLLQLNFGSFDGQYGSRAQLMAEKLLKNNLAHFLATDVHRPDTLYPEIPRIVEYLTKMVGEEKINQLTTINPGKVIENEEIEIEDFKSIHWDLLEKMKIDKK
ncbi:MAG: hypothetical protein IJ629_02040 [Clostridia bacterium]|nr:hypothetical protein [Clostridia bacterium]